MAVSSLPEGGPSYQPFQCLICKSRFTRHENLKRHAALHTRSQSDAALPCGLCDATFSRPDLRHRHMKRKHPEHQESRPTKKACRRQASPVERQEAEERSQEGDKAPTLSPPESHHSVQLHHSSDESEMEAEGGFWHTTLRYDQPPLEHARHESSESSILPPSVPPNRDTGGAQNVNLQPDAQSSINEAAAMRDIVQCAAALEQSLLLQASFLKPAFLKPGTLLDARANPIAIPNSGSFETTLASFDFSQGIPERLLSAGLSPRHEDWYPSASQIRQGCELFFAHVSCFVPFLHQPTFDASAAAPFLVLSMLCLGYQYGEDPDCGSQEGSGASLSVRCFHRARVLIDSEEENADDSTQNNPMIQTFLLLQIFAMMYLCGNDSAYGLKMHSKMISLARAGGLMQPIPMQSASTVCLNSLWREFTKAESHKRTLFAVHQVDTLWYQFLSIPRSISHLEIKHDLPCPEDNWVAATAAEWAHKRLVARDAGPSVRYSDAVRLFLSPDADLDSIPEFDPYGAINIAQFLISSAREISGWSMMTGMLSMERIEPLRSSLIALSAFIRPQPETGGSSQALCQATWEAAMIELQMWSPAHTGGIVEGSMDGVLNQSAYLAPSCEFLCKSNTAKAIQPHVDWFLRYLETTVEPGSEAPWISLYAYRAFLIAWNLVRGGNSGAMQVIGVHDGDVEVALEWARKVFRRRERWQLGKLILSSLDTLEK
ncbi:hypothetical protein GQ53DRAFT_780115 [Thozetella sp. PMI_491]|nr:hypothetical protein GQ53DRAFT_780115 [Thozetella sp. PMI_491]